MPRRATSLRTTRSNKKKHLRNLKVKNRLKKAVKKFQTLLASGNSGEAKTFIATVCSALDKAAKKNIIHAGTANRRKSRLMKRLSKTLPG